MEKEKLESLLIDYIDNRLNSVDRRTVEAELVNNADAYKLYEELKEVMYLMDRSARLEPSGKLKSSFESMLKQESASGRSGKVIFLQPALLYKIAAAVWLLILGGGAGFWISQQRRQAEEIAEMKREMEKTKLMMMAMIENEQSASQRIQGVNVALSIEKADDEVVTALVKAMNEDMNTNVRLAALEALSKFHQEPRVRKELIKSLAMQKDPVVQIALIQLMVKMKEKGVVQDLQRIVDDNKAIKAVKDEAYSGILKLS
ncbi:MAG: HEAT repeat domain-containing protein [Bacteroidota bacterium]